MLFSGQDQPSGPWSTTAASYSVGALLLLVACKGLAYGVSLSSFRGGPVFPAMFLGAAGGIALSHLPGLPWSPASPWASARCAWPCSGCRSPRCCWPPCCWRSDGLAVMPLVIVAVVVAYVVAAWFHRQRPKHRRPNPSRRPPPGRPRPRQTLHPQQVPHDDRRLRLPARPGTF